MYSTKDDLITRFGQEELDRYAYDEDGDQVDDAKVNLALTDAAEIIELYIAATVKLPLQTAPAILVSLSSDIARYRLQDDNPLDEVKARYEAAIRTLKDIANGKATLGTEEQGTTGATVHAQRTEDDRTFTSETLADF